MVGWLSVNTLGPMMRYKKEGNDALCSSSSFTLSVLFRTLRVGIFTWTRLSSEGLSKFQFHHIDFFPPLEGVPVRQGFIQGPEFSPLSSLMLRLS